MTTPHDYYDEYGEMHLHNKGESRFYVEKDLIASEADDQLPMLSTLGAGPQGAGVVPRITNNEEGNFSFDLVSDETGEVLMQSGNLSGGHISISQPKHDMVSGEVAHMDIHVSYGATVETYTVEIPTGAVGSRWFVCDHKVEYEPGDVYYFTLEDLMYDGLNSYRDKPVPRPNDLVAFVVRGKGELRLGNVEAVEGNRVVVTSRTAFSVPIPELNELGEWVIDGVNTGVKAIGPQGPKGEKGDTGARGVKGDQGPKGEKGDRGIDGLPSKIEIGNTETLPPTTPASVSVSYDPVSNISTLNFGIPEGAAGRAIEIQGGIWKPEILPPYDETPVNWGFIVYDGDRQFDLYIRGSQPVIAGDGGPWTIVEDWQGRPGSGVHILLDPYELESEDGSELHVPAAEGSLAFSPSEYISDGDIVIDGNGNIGVISSSFDDSGDYIVTTIAHQTIGWENVINKPFESVYESDGLNIDSQGILHIEPSELSPLWDKVREKPFEKIGNRLYVDDDGVLKTEPITWDDLLDKPEGVAYENPRGWHSLSGGDNMYLDMLPSLKFDGGITDPTKGLCFYSDDLYEDKKHMLFVGTYDGEMFGDGGKIVVAPATYEEGGWDNGSTSNSYLGVYYHHWDQAYIDTIHYKRLDPAIKLEWNSIEGKPETFPTTWNEVSDKPDLFPTSWDEVQGKPNTFPTSWEQVAGRPENFASTWSDIEDKPFETIGAGLAVSEDGELNCTIQLSDDEFATMDDIIEALNKALEDSGFLGEITSVVWSKVQDKPFEEIGNGLTVEDGVLKIDGNVDINAEFAEMQDIIDGLNEAIEESGLLDDGDSASWENISNKPEYFPTDWSEVANAPIASVEDVKEYFGI